MADARAQEQRGVWGLGFTPFQPSLMQENFFICPDPSAISACCQLHQARARPTTMACFKLPPLAPLTPAPPRAQVFNPGWIRVTEPLYKLLLLVGPR